IEANEVTRNEFGALMDELVECVLSICAGLSPDDGSGLVVHLPALEIYMLSVALHIKLLKVGAETPKIMVIGQDRYSLSPKEIVVPDTNQSEEHRQVAFKRSSAEVLIHLMEAGQHFAKVFRANSDHQRKSNC